VRKDYDHLRPHLRRQLERGVQIIREEFAKAIKGKASPKRKEGRILKIILFGSMARGTPRLDVNTGYRSDYDLLVVVSHRNLADDDWWRATTDALTFEQSLGALRHPYRPVFHDLQDVNDQLRRGRPFFVDIHRDGIVLYEFDTKELKKPGNLSKEEELEEATGYFEQWFQRSVDSSKLAAFSASEKMSNLAAFNLHQAIESAYHCVLLTFTLYSPKLHDIKELRARSEGLDERLIPIWPRRMRYERRAFNHIRRAYVEARYSKHYRITKELLDEATASVEALQHVVKTICEERLQNG
jgi:predicted nucleotidyltransferase/HEPN domain-containing protein